MTIPNLTKATIQRLADITKTKLSNSLFELKNIKDYPFFLIIQSTIENVLKLSIYPIKKETIIKITFYGFNLSSNFFDEISKILQKFQVIHVSGVFMIAKNYIYECYLDPNMSEIKAKDLNNLPELLI